MNKKITASLLLAMTLFLVYYSGNIFAAQWEDIEVYPSENLTEIKMLSDYYDGLKDTPMDTEIYVFKGDKEGASFLLLGGTHNNEPSGYLTAIVMLENLDVDAGTIYVIPFANKSGITHTDPQEASPLGFTIETQSGERYFKFGSRATNPIHQWPDPDVYIHASSGQKLSGSETRNLNRGYPGREDGTLTEKACLGIAEFIRQENITMTLDLHEASPEYPVINAMVAHEKSMDIAALASINMQLDGVNIALEPSPTNLHGLTHRELGDYTDTLPFLTETANPSQGRLRGATNAELALTGIDKIYEKAYDAGALFVNFDETGHPIRQRVGRHIKAIDAIIQSYNEMYPDNKLEYKNIPTYDEMMENDLGAYLK